MSARQFPIHSEDAHLLRSVPWSLVAKHEAQAIANHDQTLERLAQRGGLSLAELAFVLSGERLTRLAIKRWFDEDALEYINAKVKEHEELELERQRG